MQPVGAPFQPSWDSLATMESMEAAEVMAQMLSSYSLSSEQDHERGLEFPSMFSTDHGGESSHYDDHLISASYYWPQVCGSNPKDGGGFLPLASLESCYLSDPASAAGAIDASSVPVDFCMAEEVDASSLKGVRESPLEDPAGMNEDTSCEALGDSGGFVSCRKSSSKRKLQVPPWEKENSSAHEEVTTGAVSPKRKPQSCTDHIQKNGRNLQQKKTQRCVRNGDADESNATEKEKGCGSYSSEDDSSASQEISGGEGAISKSERSGYQNQRGKSRAGQGSSTDPQSLYARKRRERINERLRILQNLVPNGTKVDISTMLEEAVHYVKFLQLQIKLLSSDDLWMYAPIAYNGMDIGLDLKVSPPQ